MASSVAQSIGRTRTRAEGAAQVVILTLLYSLPAALVARSYTCVIDNDIWWHLAAGKWIVEHRAVPHTDPFSAYGAGKPWAAYSWAFEVPAAWLYAHCGLLGLLLLQCALVMAVVVALHRLIASLTSDFSDAAMLTFAAIVAMYGVLTPRPWLLTILFFILELRVILRVRDAHDYRQLMWLPLIFCAWVNVHVQFVYGLFLLMLAVGEAWLKWQMASGDRALRRSRDIWTVTVLVCFAATLLNPYFIGIYEVAYQLGTQPLVRTLISELGPIPFLSWDQNVLLLIGLGAVGTLAWRREREYFPWVLLVWAVFWSFRSHRDLWLMTVVGVATIAANLPNRMRPHPRLSKLQACGIAIGVVLVSGCSYIVLGLSGERLQQEMASRFPAAAVEVVRQRGLPGPLYNNYDWGGYLIWSLPGLPVAIDGRATLHGTPRIERSGATWQAEHGWNSDPELQNARLVIGARDSSLCAVLRLDPRYELAYEDHVASVFVRRKAR
jgi:hypothetical protein